MTLVNFAIASALLVDTAPTVVRLALPSCSVEINATSRRLAQAVHVSTHGIVLLAVSVRGIRGLANHPICTQERAKPSS